MQDSQIAAFIQNVPQIVPEEWCLRCKVCCRFPSREEVQTPTWSAQESGWARETKKGEAAWFQKAEDSPSLIPVLQPCGHGYRCPAFEPETNQCAIYSVRPLDCRLYPFVLTQDAAKTKVVLAMDMKCPYLQEHGTDSNVAAYAQELASALETPTGLAYLKTNPNLIGPSWPEFLSVAALPSLVNPAQEPASSPHPALQPLTIDQRSMLQEAFEGRRHGHSTYTLAGILGWSDLLHLWWTRIEEALCLFAEQAGGWFMPLPPMGKKATNRVFSEAWEILEELNGGSEVSRIEGIEAAEAGRLAAYGFEISPGEPEYLYRREDLVNLRGDRYRSQRWAVNRFQKRFSYRIRPFEEPDLLPCLQLYTTWCIQRQQKRQETFPKALMRDGLFFHRRLMLNHREMNLAGRVLEIADRIRGYTFGAPVCDRLLGLFLEITDRSFPGLAQTLCREFFREMDRYPLINAMGDCGLSSLRQVKLAYRPIGHLPVWTAKRKLVDQRGFEPLTS